VQLHHHLADQLVGNQTNRRNFVCTEIQSDGT
jgi:hypothetical protein